MRLILSLLLFAITTSACGDSKKSTPSTQRLQDASRTPISVRWHNGTLRSVKGDFDGAVSSGDDAAHADVFVAAFADELGLADPMTDLRTPVVLGIGTASTAVVYERVFQGVPVYGSQIRVHVGRDGRIGFVSAGVPKISSSLNTMASLSADDAVASAISASGVPAALATTTELTIWDPGLFASETASKPVLTYRVVLSGGVGGTSEFFIDANKGDVLRQRSEVASSTYIYNANDSSDQINFSAVAGGHRDEQGIFLGQSSCTDAIIPCLAWSPESSLCCGSNALWLVDDVEQSPDTDTEATTLSGHLKTVNEYFASEVGYQGWDGKDADIHAFVHLGTPSFKDSHWVPAFQAFFFSDRGLTLDIVAHEWAHAVNTGSPWPLPLSGEQGAIGEAMGDIFAAILTDDWVINQLGTDGTPEVLRDLQADATRAIADTTSSLRDPKEATDSGHVHFNSGIISRTADLLVHGKTHWVTEIEVRKVDADKVLAIYFRALRLYLLPTSTFKDARWQIEEACTSLVDWEDDQLDITYEDCGALINAFAAVGLGEPDPDLDTWVGDSDNCLGVYPDSFNPDQLDSDGDGLGDQCSEPLPTGFRQYRGIGSISRVLTNLDNGQSIQCDDELTVLATVEEDGSLTLSGAFDTFPESGETPTCKTGQGRLSLNGTADTTAGTYSVDLRCPIDPGVGEECTTSATTLTGPIGETTMSGTYSETWSHSNFLLSTEVQETVSFDLTLE